MKQWSIIFIWLNEISWDPDQPPMYCMSLVLSILKTIRILSSLQCAMSNMRKCEAEKMLGVSNNKLNTFQFVCLFCLFVAIFARPSSSFISLFISFFLCFSFLKFQQTFCKDGNILTNHHTYNNPIKNHFYKPQSNENLRGWSRHAWEIPEPKSFLKFNFILTGTPVVWAVLYECNTI